MVSKRSTMPSLLGLVLAMAQATTALPSYTASTADCIKASRVELARQSSCGNRNALAECFSSADNDGYLVGSLEWCFVSAGCSPSNAKVEAFWTLRRCEPDADADADLRRRKRADLGVMPAMREPAIFEAREATTTTASNEPSPSVCYTTVEVKMTACITPVGAKTTQCGPSTMPSLECAAGLICRTDNEGNPVCMFAEHIGAAGIFVAAYMIAAVVVGTAAVCFFCMRERRSQKRIERAAEAAAMARETKNSSAAVRRATSGAGAPSVVEDSAPLMMSRPPRDPSPYHGRDRNPFSETSNTLS